MPSTNWEYEMKPGSGIEYNEPNVLYNSTLDPLTDQNLTYNTSALTTTWTLESN